MYSISVNALLSYHSTISISFWSFTAKLARAATASIFTAIVPRLARDTNLGIPPTEAIRALFSLFTPKLASAADRSGGRTWRREEYDKKVIGDGNYDLVLEGLCFTFRGLSLYQFIRATKQCY
jgi:hypothetical protein